MPKHTSTVARRCINDLYTSAMGAIGAIAALAVIASCGSDTSPTEGQPIETQLIATVHLMGSGNDADGFLLTIAGKQFSVNGDSTVTVAGLSPGSYTATLTGIADNCWSDTASAQTTVANGASTHVDFVVECMGGLAYSRQNGNGGDIVYLGQDGRTTQITAVPGQHYVQDWSSDGTHPLVLQFDLSMSPAIASFWIASLDGTPVRELSIPPFGLEDLVAHFSPDGSRVLFARTTAHDVAPYNAIRVIDVSGANEHDVIPDAPGQVVAYPSWSPDGSRITFVSTQYGQNADPTYRVEAALADGSRIDTLAGGLASASYPVWSPSGQLIAVDGFLTKQSVFTIPAGGGTPTSIWTATSTASDYRWSPDGQHIALDIADGTKSSIAVATPDGTPIATPGANLPEAEAAEWSSDGQWILFQSLGPEGRQAIYVTRPSGSDVHLIAHAGVDLYSPMWNPTAKPGASSSSAVRRTQGPRITSPSAR